MSVADADPTCSRMTQSSGRIACRFDGHIPSVDVKIRHGLPSRCMKPLMATTHLFVLADTDRADARGVQNDSDPFGSQTN
jgi:hypothetical protein